VEYDVAEPVTTVEAARKPGAPEVARGPNEHDPSRSGDAEAVAKAHASADVVIESEYRTQVQTHSCLETHGCVCAWKGDELTVWASTQGTFSVRGQMAKTLSIPESRITVITEHMGGGFGSKFGVDAWDAFCARAAKATERPCRLMLDRREEHMVAGNRPNSIQRCKFSAGKDGTLLGGEVRSWGTGGVGGGAGVYNPGIYAFRATYSEQSDVLTHAGSARAFRAPRHPQGIFALEGMMDELAEAIGMDPVEFRLRNDRHPVRQAQWNLGRERIGWSARKPTGSQTGRMRRGFGCAAARWPNNGRPGTEVRIRVGKDGSVLAVNGSQDLGTGTRTVIAIVAAEELGLKPADIAVRLGNTNDPYGHGSGGSVTTPSMAPAVREAAFLVKRRLLDAVAAALGVDAAGLDLRDGKVTGAGRDLGFAKACALLPTDAIEETGRGDPEDFLYPSFAGDVAGAQFAEVEVDTWTGRVRVLRVVAVQDCGVVIDTLTARSQINGGVIQGISYALFEDRLLDPSSGDMCNADFLGYKIAGALDMPEIVALTFPVAEGRTSTGASSLGEPPTTPTSGAVANAVANALGARVRSLPITPDKVLAALGGLKG